MNKKELALDIIGFLLFSLGVAAVTNSLFAQNISQILWSCYIGLLVMGIGVLKRNSFLIMTQVYILAIPTLIWDIDFLHWVIFHTPLWGLTNYFFQSGFPIISKVISSQHLFSIPLAILSVRLIGLKRKDAWKWSFLQIFIVYILVTLLTSKGANVNCVFTSCIKFPIPIPYQIEWFAIFFGMTFLASVLVNKFLIKELKK